MDSVSVSMRKYMGMYILVLFCMNTDVNIKLRYIRIDEACHLADYFVWGVMQEPCPPTTTSKSYLY